MMAERVGVICDALPVRAFVAWSLALEMDHYVNGPVAKPDYLQIDISKDINYWGMDAYPGVTVWQHVVRAQSDKRIESA